MSLRLGRYLSEVLVQALLRSCLVAILVVTLVEAPVYGSPSAALGVVLQAQNASVGSGVAATGATIFNGDGFTRVVARALGRQPILSAAA